jgi:hypothetical protein
LYSALLGDWATAADGTARATTSNPAASHAANPRLVEIRGGRFVIGICSCRDLTAIPPHDPVASGSTDPDATGPRGRVDPKGADPTGFRDAATLPHH